MDRERLHAGVRRLPAPRRPCRGSPRPQARVPRRRRDLHRRLATQRARANLGVPHHLPRRAGPRRRTDRARGALHHHDDLRRRSRAREGHERLGRDRGRRRGRQPGARRHPRRRVLVAVDLLRERPGWNRPSSSRLSATYPSRRTKRAHKGFDIARSDNRHSRPGHPRLRDREGTGEGLGLPAHTRGRRACDSAARGVRLHRAALGGSHSCGSRIFRVRTVRAANVAMFLVARRALRDVLLQHAVPPARPGLLRLSRRVSRSCPSRRASSSAPGCPGASCRRSAPRELPLIGMAMAIVGMLLFMRLQPGRVVRVRPLCRG